MWEKRVTFVLGSLSSQSQSQLTSRIVERKKENRKSLIIQCQ